MYRLVVNLLRPYTIVSLLTALAIANLWRRRRESRGRLLLVTLPYGVLTIMSLPVVSYLALGTLEWQYPPLRQRPADAEAMVVLGGSVLPADAGRARAELGRSTFARCQYAIEFSRRSKPCPILVSGGKVDSDSSSPAVSILMRDFLLGQGVRPGDVVVEDRSLSSYENAVESARLLRAREFERSFWSPTQLI